MLSVSMNLILDELADLRHQIYFDLPCSKRFSRAALYSADQPLDPERLYVCLLSDYLRDFPSAPDVYCLCLRDRQPDMEETEERLAGTVVVEEEITLNALFNRVQDVFLRISDWIHEMQEKVIACESLQCILDVSEPILGNTVNISDSALALLAHTRHIEPLDDITKALVANGFHPEPALQKFREGNRFEVWNQTSGIFVNEHPNYCDFVTVNRVFNFRGTYFAHAVMVCDHRPLTPGLLELFRIFTGVLQTYVKREWDSNSTLTHAYDALLTDLLNGTLTSKSDLEERARPAGIPLTGPYQVLRVACNPEMQVPVGRLAQELGNLMPDAWVLIYQQKLVVLTQVKTNVSQEAASAAARRMQGFLERYDAVCAVSPEFSNLSLMADAYEKANLALKYGGRFYGDELLDRYDYGPGSKRIYQYDDNLAFYLLGENDRSQSIWKSSSYAQALRTLREYDLQHNTDNLQLLYTYLRCERRATEASQLLHMHRNNVLYRVGRIEELLGLSLDDDNVRLCLTISYLMLRLVGLEE